MRWKAVKKLNPKLFKRLVGVNRDTFEKMVSEAKRIQSEQPKKIEGKKDFIAITFIGKLRDSLADDLCGLAKTMTMHGFARRFVSVASSLMEK